MTSIPLKSTLTSVMLLVALNVSANDLWTQSYTLEANAKYDAAATTIESYLQDATHNEYAQMRSGWLYYLAGNYSRAIKHYENALRLNKQSIEARLGLALPLLAQSRWKEAANQCDAVIKIAPWNYFAHVRLLIAEEGQKQWKTMARHALEVYQRYPTDATVLVYLARAYKQLGETSKARQAYTQVLARIPGHLEASEFVAD